MKQNYTKAFHRLIILLFGLMQGTLCFTQNNQQALQALKQYVSSHKQNLGIDQKDADNLFITYDYVDKSTGINHIYAAQKLNGLTIINSDFSLHTLDAKQIVANHLIATAKYKLTATAASVTAKDAVFTLMDAINYNVTRTLQIKQQSTGADNYTIFQRNASSIWDIPCR